MAMATALSPLGTVTPYGASAYGVSASGAAGDPARAGNPIVARDDPTAVQQAVELSGDASVILSLSDLGGFVRTAPADTGLIYNAAGLFDRIVSAGPADTAATSPPGTSTAASPPPSQNQATQAYDQGLLDTLTTPPLAPGLYDDASVFSSQGLTPPLSSLLQANPDLSGTMVGDLLNQGIVGGLLDTSV
jgi:hypothetical protein